MDQQKITYKAKITKAAMDLYEYYERDYDSFINSRLRAIKYCNAQISNSNLSEQEKLTWLDVKTELQNSKL
jgi:hypothetical protein